MASQVYKPRISNNYAFLIVIAIFSALAGLLVAFGNIKIDALILGLVFGGTVLFIPLKPIYWGMAIICFLIVGQLEYFARLTMASWLPCVVGFGFYFRIPLEYLKSLRDSKAVFVRFPTIVVPIYLFFAAFIISSAINFPPAIQILVGARVYLPYFSFLFVLLINYPKAVDILDGLWNKFYFIAVIQIPLLLYQFFVIAPMRSDAGGRRGMSDDAMVGGFGGDPMGGGSSGAMAYVMVLVLALVLTMWKKKQADTSKLIFIIIAVMLAVILAEVKIVIVLFPIMMGWVYRRSLIRNPAYFLMALLFAFGFVATILILYSKLHTTIRGSDDLAGMLDQAFGYSLDADFVSTEYRHMTRLQGLLFWWNENGFDDIIHTVFGYGPSASSSSSSTYISKLARRYPYDLVTSLATAILWDMGLLGFFSYVAMLLLSAWRALTLVRSIPDDGFATVCLDVSGLGLLLMMIMMPYGSELAYVPAMQFLLMSMLAYIGVFDMLIRKKNRVDL